MTASADQYRRQRDAAMTEAQLQNHVIDAAQKLGWRIAHFRPALTSKGWRTPVEADGKGFPDLCMAHPIQRRIVFAELKRMKGTIEPEQREWLQVLGAITDIEVGERDWQLAEVYVWRPSDWSSGRIERVLSGEEDQ